MSNAIKAGLYAKLIADGTLTALLAAGTAGVHERLATEGEAMPYVLYDKQAGTPYYTLTGLSHEDQIYQVKGVVDEPTPYVAGQIADAIDSALTDQALTVSGKTQMYLRRVGDVDYAEIRDGRRINYAGGLYRVMVT